MDYLLDYVQGAFYGLKHSYASYRLSRGSLQGSLVIPTHEYCTFYTKNSELYSLLTGEVTLTGPLNPPFY